MKLPVKVFFVIAFLCQAVYMVSAQSYESDMRKLARSYQAAHLTSDMRIRLYSGHTGSTLLQESTCEYHLWENNISYKMNDVELLANDKYHITVNHGAKVIVVNRAKAGEDKKFLKDLMRINADTLFKNSRKATISDDNPRTRTWRVELTNQSHMIEYLEVTLNKGTFTFDKLVVYYRRSFNDIYGTMPKQSQKDDKPRAEISYSNTRSLSEKDKLVVFNESKIIRKGKSGFIPASSYAGYTMADYYHIK